jgi:hypothetical protein
MTRAIRQSDASASIGHRADMPQNYLTGPPNSMTAAVTTLAAAMHTVPLAAPRANRYSFHNKAKNLRELMDAECPERIESPIVAPHPSPKRATAWLACYPLFQDALMHGLTSLGALPKHARQVVLERTPVHLAERAQASTLLDDVGASYIELATSRVEEAVRGFLAAQTGRARPQEADCATTLEELATQVPSIDCPRFARPPCVLQPGNGVFLDGWMRFFAYRARRDPTIALVAVDWPDVYRRLDARAVD